MATFNVSNSSQLNNALGSANGGDTILLASGTYADIDMRGTKNSNLVASSEITIKSANSDNPAVINNLYMQDVRNITFDGIVFDFNSDSGTKSGALPFQVHTSEDVTFINSTFDGDVHKGSSSVEKGYGTGFGIKVMRSDDITIENNSFTDFRVATAFADVSNVRLVGNTYDRTSGDSMKFSEISGALIEGNIVRSIRANQNDPFHRDMIQFLSTNTDTPSTNITIRGNILHSGDYGIEGQSIFIRNEAVDSQGGGNAMYYQNFLIEDNLIYNAQRNSIYVGHADGITVRNNTVLHNTASGDGQGKNIPAIDVYNSQDVDIIKNITHKIVTNGNSQENISGNLLVQHTNPNGSNYYGDLFVDPFPAPATVEGLQANPNGIIEQQGIGAAVTRGADYSTDAGTGASTPQPSEPDEPEPTPPATIDEIKLNAGSGSANGFDNDAGYVSGGSTYKNSKSIAGTTQDGIYQSERYGDFSYDIPVENGEYTVILKFAEIYFNSVGAREFDVRAEGKTVINDLDIVKAAGGANRAYDVTLEVDVNDGKLDLDFISGDVDLAKLSGLEVRAGASGGSNGGSTGGSDGGSSGGSGSGKYDLVVANRYDRSDAKDLEGAQIDDGDRGFVFVNGADSGVSKVDFYFDNPSAAGSPTRTDTDAPFDFVGTGGGAKKAPMPWYTSNIADGEHTITARITETDGDQVVITDTFDLV